MSVLRIIYILLIIFSIRNALAADSVQLPSNYSVNATDWVTLADSGTTPAISGFTNAFVIVSTTAGNIKITTTTSLAAVNGFCGYDQTNEKTGGDYLSGDEPSNCSGSSLTELGFTGTQAAVNTALATLQFKGSNPAITIKAYETDSDPVHYYKETGHFYKVVRDENSSWSTVVNAAEDDSYLGLSGYLAHITSQGEDEFIFYIYDNHSHAPVGTETAWIGGTDRNAVSEDGIWLWEGGPSDEHLKIFYCDDSGGGAVDEGSSCTVDSGFEYNNWNKDLSPEQPDDDGGPNGETLAVIIHDPSAGANGTWGDVNYAAHARRDHYVIEYNHEDTLDTNNYATNSITINTDSAWDTTTKAINNAQSFTAREIIRTSIDMVTERMEFTRNLPHNISKQGIKLDLDVNNENAKKVLNSLQPHLLNQSGRLFDQWSIWTRGNISTGKVGETNDALGQNIHSDGLTVGIDRKTLSNTTIGIAFNRFWRETEIGNNNATVDTDSFNVMYYGSIMPREKYWFDFTLGYGELDIDFIRKVGSGNNTANRDGQQIFGSVKYTIHPHDNSPDSTDTFFYSKLDAGYTSLNEYAESGSSQTIHYNKQHIQVYTFALGTTLNREIEIDQGTIMPFLRFEFGANGTNHSLSEAYYTTSPSQISTHAMSDDATAHGRFGLGAEVDLHNNWEIRVAYDRYDSTDDSFTNIIFFTVKKKL